MNKLSAFWPAIALLTLGACGKDPAPAASEKPDEPAARIDAPVAAPAQLASDEVAQSPATTPAEAVSETVEPADAAARNAVVQPSLRLGAKPEKPATSLQFREGAHYQKVVPAQPTNAAPGKVEVAEVFWYGCGHCFTLDPAIESWRGKGKAGYVEFVRVPAMWNETTRMHARVFYTAELLGKLDAVHSLIFREFHVKNNPLNSVDAIAAFFKQQGVSGEEFQKAFASFAVENKLQRADFLNRRYRIDSVPTMIINGKYKTDIGEAGGEPQLFTLIDELAAHEHGG